jgi:hypothetical protein
VHNEKKDHSGKKELHSNSFERFKLRVHATYLYLDDNGEISEWD